MDDSLPLHKAHAAGRQAVKLLRKGLLQEAADLHLRAAKLLQELLQSLPKDSPVIRSLAEQIRYHKRQAELTQVIRNLEKQGKLKAPTTTNTTMAGKDIFTKIPHSKDFQNQGSGALRNHENQSHSRETFDAADSLFPFHANVPEKPGNSQAKIPGFAIRPRKDSEVIEELQTVNSNLRNLIDDLMKQLHDVKEENKMLKSKLGLYESSEVAGMVCEEVVPVVASTHRPIYTSLPDRIIPELAPLGVFHFEFNG